MLCHVDPHALCVTCTLWCVQRGSVTDVYRDKYKGIALALAMLSRALNGSYVNFGVFELYKDPALDSALEAAIQMALAIPAKDVVVYSKVAKSYFVFLEALCHNHTAYLVRQPQVAFDALVGALGRGLVSVDVQTSSQCAMAIDNLASWLHRNLSADASKVHPATQVRACCSIGTLCAPVPTTMLHARSLITCSNKSTLTPSSEARKALPGSNAQTRLCVQLFVQHLNAQPSLFPDLLYSLFDIVLFDECLNQWSLSRPMLSLILVITMTHEAEMGKLKERLIATQPADKQAFLAQCLDKLMKDVDGTLDSKNRDRFTQNLSPVRHDFKARNWS
jgi:exportin-7